MKKFALLAAVAVFAATVIGCGPTTPSTKPATPASTPASGK